jgi:hypothetical protein
MPNYTLGELPWSQSTLRSFLFKKSLAVYKYIKEHPGYQYLSDLEALEFSLSLYKQSAGEHFKAVNEFENLARNLNFTHRDNATQFQKVEFNIRKTIFNYSTAMMSLVNHIRKIDNNQTVKFPSHTIFSTDARHRFLQDLRNCLAHVKSIKPDWQISYDKNRKTMAKYLFKTSVLLEYKEWSRLARHFIESNSDEIDIRKTINEHYIKFMTHQLHVLKAYSSATSKDIDEYKGYERFLKGIGARQLWFILLQQIAIPSKIDPYPKLPLYLTRDEIISITRLNHKSTAQVDKIIQYVDEYNICNEELRSLVYIVFNARSDF